jgi:hypothetical protein
MLLVHNALYLIKGKGCSKYNLNSLFYHQNGAQYVHLKKY